MQIIVKVLKTRQKYTIALVKTEKCFLEWDIIEKVKMGNLTEFVA